LNDTIFLGQRANSIKNVTKKRYMKRYNFFLVIALTIISLDCTGSFITKKVSDGKNNVIKYETEPILLFEKTITDSANQEWNINYFTTYSYETSVDSVSVIEGLYTPYIPDSLELNFTFYNSEDTSSVKIIPVLYDLEKKEYPIYYSGSRKTVIEHIYSVTYYYSLSPDFFKNFNNAQKVKLSLIDNNKLNDTITLDSEILSKYQEIYNTFWLGIIN